MSLITKLTLAVLFAFALLSAPFVSAQEEEESEQKQQQNVPGKKAEKEVKEKNPYAKFFKDLERADKKIAKAKNDSSKRKEEEKRKKIEEKFEKRVERDKESIEKKREALEKKLENAKDDKSTEKILAEINALDAQIAKIDKWASSSGEEEEEDDDDK